jgi:hypothetical protein
VQEINRVAADLIAGRSLVRRSDVARIHGKLSASPYQANRSLAVVSAMWNWRRAETK